MKYMYMYILVANDRITRLCTKYIGTIAVRTVSVN